MNYRETLELFVNGLMEKIVDREAQGTFNPRELRIYYDDVAERDNCYGWYGFISLFKGLPNEYRIAVAVRAEKTDMHVKEALHFIGDAMDLFSKKTEGN